MQEGKSRGLISAIVVHYNNGDLIYETLDSILTQDYPEIELIVSDDKSPVGFDANAILAYIENHKRNNIKNIIINENKENLGTVRHLEVIRGLSGGEFEISIAADDVWKYTDVFTSFIELFNKLGPDAQWIVSQVEMCDYTMQKMNGLFMPDNIIELVKRKDRQGLLNIECHSCILPGLGSAFRRLFFDKIGSLSEDYYLVEDYSTHLRALRLGIMPHYLDKVTAKHRSGGISHGNVRNGQELHMKLLHDYVRAFELEVLPYPELFAKRRFFQSYMKYVFNKNRYQQEATTIIQANNYNLPAFIDESLLCHSPCTIHNIKMLLMYNLVLKIYLNKEKIINTVKQFTLSSSALSSFYTAISFYILSVLLRTFSGICHQLKLLSFAWLLLGLLQITINLIIKSINHLKHRQV